LPDLKTRWKSALFGASIGLLAAVLVELLGVPLGPLGQPVLLAILGVIAGVTVGVRHAWTIAAWLAVAVAIFVGTIVYTPMVDGSIERWVRSDGVPPDQVDAVVVLSAGVTREGRIASVGLERLAHGLMVARVTHARLLVTTNPEGSPQGDAREIVAALGDTNSWREIGPVGSTRDEATRLAELFSPASGRRVAVVTSPLHSRRSCATFEAVGFRVICLPNPGRSYPFHELSAGTPRWRAFRDLVYERLAMMKYRSRGWVRE
jgi:uncharacterized SAM-binding protein YcdF (DUF218 family)